MRRGTAQKVNLSAWEKDKPEFTPSLHLLSMDIEPQFPNVQNRVVKDNIEQLTFRAHDCHIPGTVKNPFWALFNSHNSPMRSVLIISPFYK